MMTEIETLIAACQKQDRKAQKRLYDLYAGKMLAICFRYVKSREDAEDVLQEGFLKIFQQFNTYRNEGSFEGWMKRIFVGLSIDFFRKNRKFDFNLPVEEAENVGVNDVLSSFSVNEILEAIASLSDGYRLVFNMYAIEGFSHKEIADKLNISEGTSKSQLARAKMKLVELLKNKNIYAHG